MSEAKAPTEAPPNPGAGEVGAVDPATGGAPGSGPAADGPASTDDQPNTVADRPFNATKDPSPPPQTAGSTAAASTTSATASSGSAAARKRDFVVYTARLSMAVYLVDQGVAGVEKIARDHGGYVGRKADHEITVRVPRDRFEAALAAIDGLGDVIHRDVQAMDVTEEHVDLEIRIKNARAMQKRLSDLLAKADVKEALEIEKELRRVTEELERLEGRLKVLRDQIAYSTITVTFAARASRIAAGRPRLPFSWLARLNLPSLLSLSENK